MKRFILAAAFFMMSLCFGDNLSAGNFGVLGGANFHAYDSDGAGRKTLTRWHAGVVYKASLPLGFQIQPSLLYSVKTAETAGAPEGLSVGCLELLASMQWGVDLILFRPFVEVVPFVGYGLNGWGNLGKIWSKEDNRLEYGVGVGGGLQIWRFQVNARYNWNFGNLMPPAGPYRGADFSGVTLSLAYFF